MLEDPKSSTHVQMPSNQLLAKWLRKSYKDSGASIHFNARPKRRAAPPARMLSRFTVSQSHCITAPTIGQPHEGNDSQRYTTAVRQPNGIQQPNSRVSAELPKNKSASPLLSSVGLVMDTLPLSLRHRPVLALRSVLKFVAVIVASATGGVAQNQTGSVPRCYRAAVGLRRDRPGFDTFFLTLKLKSCCAEPIRCSVVAFCLSSPDVEIVGCVAKTVLDDAGFETTGLWHNPAADGGICMLWHVGRRERSF
ncbi:hypothetical protein JOL62DRAFT_132952 [Phyllosticta paracitricarpa]|uniref:Uncharacterized protein n=1 Tax=Phyllosticta paracitricarpa TaxID=2016321 RepID=A0ABR1NIC2_9PEZI